MFNARPPVPRFGGSWDGTTVVDYLRSCPSEGLSTLELGRKVVTLLALANAGRCSDLAALDRDYLRWTPQFTVVPRFVPWVLLRQYTIPHYQTVVALQLYHQNTQLQFPHLSQCL